MADNEQEPEQQRQTEALQQRIADLEDQLQKSEKRFNTLIDSAPVGIMMDDALGRAIFVNKKCAELVGVDPEDTLNFDYLPYLHPDDRERMISEWKKAFQNSAEFHLEYRWVHSDGKVVWTLGDVVPILGEDGKATQYVGTLTDITAEKEAQIEKEQLAAQLVQAQKMEIVGNLAGGVAHDYNNMLNVILNYAEIAMDELEDKSCSIYEYLLEIVKSAKRSAEVTRQLLSFARKQTVSPAVFDINSALQEISNMLRQLISKDVDLIFSPEDRSIPIRMDHSEFDRIVVNLCINARDAIDGIGKITIETATMRFDEAFCERHTGYFPGEFAVLSIQDNGSGMDSAVLNNIFEPFFTTKEKHKGTGLGLASVYGAVKQNNGFIQVESKPGEGSTFNIYIPIHVGQIPEPTSSVVAPIQDGSEHTILVVEDEASSLSVIKRILGRAGYKVLASDSPCEALKLASDCKDEIDLLLTDVIMPGMNGEDLAQKLKADRPNIKCLYMSGYASDVMSNQTTEGSVNFIQKPFGVKDLIANVHKTLDGE